MAHSIGKTIAELRKEKGWTQVELAEKLQVSDKAVSKWEKDDAFPSVEFFPVLAELFGVSIDYLMTGKTPEKEIVLMSKMELCAKNDDIDILSDIRIDSRDENGKTIVDYAKSYESKRVLTAIINRYGFERITSSWENFAELLYFAVWTNTLDLLISKFDSKRYDGNSNIKFWATLTALDEKCLMNPFLQKLFEYLVTDESVPLNIFDILFSEYQKSAIISGNPSIGYTYCKPVWDIGVAYLLECAVKKQNMKLFEQYLQFIIAYNQKSKNAIETVAKDRYCNHSDYYGNTPLKIAIRENPYIVIRISTIEWLIANENIELAERLHNLNIAFGLVSIDNDMMRLAKLKTSKNISADELIIQSSIHRGILSVNEILATKNYELIRTALLANPIHIIEILISWYTEENWRAMFEYAIDNKVCFGGVELAKLVVNFDKKRIGECIFDAWNKRQLGGGINAEHFYYFENGMKKNLFSPNCQKYLNTRRKTPEEITLMIVDALQEIAKEIDMCKKRIIDDLALQLDQESTIDGLTKDYFYTQLNSGNVDIAIIKLCVRLETVLRCTYRYEGDFSEMLKKYCDHMDNTSDNKTIKLLNSLRIKRNNIVHSEKIPCELTIEDICYCIEYICKMG